ncbi:MAG: fumarate hydratase [Oscillospiraceae bacterium]|jgi:hypothetical protein|nr:fumarate hydratase [Oscillospiraceae bacterium]
MIPPLTQSQQDALTARVYRKYGSILAPERAIMLEAAGEAEIVPEELAHFQQLTARFIQCAERGAPLCPAPNFAVFARDDGSVDVHISENPVHFSFESRLPFGLGLTKDLAQRISTAADDNPQLPRPVCAAIAISATADGAAALLSRARCRRADEHNEKKALFAFERRLLGFINRFGSGAAGCGGGHTALTCKLESEENLPSLGFTISVILDSSFSVSVNLSEEQLRSL